jgi:hypothetical protein
MQKGTQLVSPAWWLPLPWPRRVLEGGAPLFIVKALAAAGGAVRSGR